jgi:hypothetical protein
MKYFFPALFICLLFAYCKSQRRLSRTTKETLAMIRSQAYREIDISCDPEKRMTVYSDSLNNLKEDSPLPAFLYNERFDIWRLCWPNLHEPVSLRLIVINKVTNKSVIERILKDDSPLLRKVSDFSELPLPEVEKSWYELFRLRYAELK